MIEQAIAERGRRPLREWVENTWLRLGGPACVEDETALEDAAAYFDLLAGLAEGADLADFDWFREQVNALFAQPTANASEVLQLMTIHKAKGLEFDTVILPGLGAIPRGDDQRLLLWMEHRGELLLAPIAESGGDKDPIYSYLAGIERRKSDQETARLLYVAVTRARCSLHLLGSVTAKDDGTFAQPESRSFLKLLWPAVAEQFANPDAGVQEEQADRAKTIRRLPASWRIPPAPAPVQWKRPGWSERSGPRWRSNGRAAARVPPGPRCTDSCSGSRARVWTRGPKLPCGRAARPIERCSRISVCRQPTWHGPSSAVESGLLRTLRDPRGRWILETTRTQRASCRWLA